VDLDEMFAELEQVEKLNVPQDANSIRKNTNNDVDTIASDCGNVNNVHPSHQMDDITQFTEADFKLNHDNLDKDLADNTICKGIATKFISFLRSYKSSLPRNKNKQNPT